MVSYGNGISAAMVLCTDHRIIATQGSYKAVNVDVITTNVATIVILSAPESGQGIKESVFTGLMKMK